MTTIDLGPIRLAFPYWHFWPGVTGLLYAQRRRHSPPVTRRDTDLDGLWRQVAAWEAGNPPPVILG